MFILFDGCLNGYDIPSQHLVNADKIRVVTPIPLNKSCIWLDNGDTLVVDRPLVQLQLDLNK